MNRLYTVLAILFSVCITSCRSQNIIVQKKDGIYASLPGFYAKDGIILTHQPSLNVFKKLKYVSYYNPTDSDILRAETLFNYKFIDLLNKRNGNTSFDPAKDKNLYKEWSRQYLPFVDAKGNKIIFVTMLKCCHSNVSKCYPDWKKELAFTLSDGSCSGESRFIVNLTANTLSLF